MKNEDLRKEYLKQIENMSIQDALKYIHDIMFFISMEDTWDNETREAYDILCDIERNLQKGVKK